MDRQDEAAPRSPLRSLTGLRFLAALAVFGTHLSPGVGETPLHHLTWLWDQGGLGVDLFFVLSGFILTWSHRHGDRALGFYRRRFARVYPNHVVVWLVYATALTLLATGPDATELVAGLALVQSWSSNLGVIYAVNSPAWTLSCEALFYLLFPALLAVTVRRSATAQSVLLAAVVAVWLGLGGYQVTSSAAETKGTRTYWLTHVAPPARLLEFAAGILTCLLCRRVGRALPVWPAALATVGTYLLAGQSELFGFVFLPCVCALLAALASADAHGQGTWLAGRWPVQLGVWSYAFYLVHYGTLKALEGTGWDPTTLASGLGLAVVGLALSLLAAVALFTLVERPAERRLRGDRPRAFVS